MAIELQNKIKINGVEYEIAKTLDAPASGSDKPVSSNYIYNLVRQLNGFIGKSVTTNIEAGNNNVPTSAAVYNKIQSLSGLDPANVPSGCTLVFRYTDGNLYYQNGDELTLISIAGQSPSTAINVDYDENNHSLVYGNVQINASEAIDESEIE